MGMLLAVIVSALGMCVHTVSEFGVAGLLDPATGTIPVLLIQGLLLLAWWAAPGRRSAIALALAAIGLIQLVGGGIISVLPLPVLPFAPAQTLGHYLTHAIYGLAQVPLIVVALKLRRAGRPQAGMAHEQATR